MAGPLPAPAWIAHADWGSAPRKRVVASAERHAGGYYVHAPRTVAAGGPLLERLGIPLPGGETALLGFDFVLGLPRTYADRAGIDDFGRWLRAVDVDGPIFRVAEQLAEVSIERPFFPARLARRSPGIKQAFHARLGLSADEVLRLCERAHAGRRSASELFWTLGPKAVGRATLSGWRDAVRPALADPEHRYAMWPFDGGLETLLTAPGAVIVEAYPAEAYVRLGLAIGRRGAAKTRQESRRREAARLGAWCHAAAVTLAPALRAQIDDGFGSGAGGEDAFDATVGVLGMIDAITHPPDPLLPDDDAIRHREGWIFGRPVPPALHLA